MKQERHLLLFCFLILTLLPDGMPGSAAAGGPPDASAPAFPRTLESYGDHHLTDIPAILLKRIEEEPFNLAATLIFFAAIIHTFLASRFLRLAHKWEVAHEEKVRQGLVGRNSVHLGAELFHFLGEVEVVFGLWVIALVGAILFFHDWDTVVGYITRTVNFTEPMFVVVIMALASTRPILKLSEGIMWQIARMGGGSLTAWWWSILTLGPLLGSFITEPAAMTISALLLAGKFFELEPSEKFKYATLGLLFVNVSVGGTLTHFAAPPVLMVSGPWHWDTPFMLIMFGWKAACGIGIANLVYYLLFREEMGRLQEKFAMRALREEIRTTYLSREVVEKEFDEISTLLDTKRRLFTTVDLQIQTAANEIRQRLQARYLEQVLPHGVDRELACEAFEERFDQVLTDRIRQLCPGVLPESERAPYIDPNWDSREDPVPAWVMIVHVLFMAWTIFNAHHPEIFVPGILFFLGFASVTAPFQNRIDLKSPMLVGFFLGGLVIHGGVQGWWIGPVLGNLSEIPLMIGATILTAFNDNAAITLLSTLVPHFSESLKYAVVAGAVTGGGLTVIANAPNPAGQSLLKQYFENGVSAMGLLKAALLPTLIIWHIFLLFLVIFD